jgi:hypothetical protein
MPSKPIEPSAEMVAEISARLARICQSFTPSEFDTLVRQIASVRMKYEALRDEMSFFAPRIAGGGHYARSQPPDDGHIVGPRS